VRAGYEIPLNVRRPTFCLPRLPEAHSNGPACVNELTSAVHHCKNNLTQKRRSQGRRFTTGRRRSSRANPGVERHTPGIPRENRKPPPKGQEKRGLECQFTLGRFRGRWVGATEGCALSSGGTKAVQQSGCETHIAEKYVGVGGSRRSYLLARESQGRQTKTLNVDQSHGAKNAQPTCHDFARSDRPEKLERDSKEEKRKNNARGRTTSNKTLRGTYGTDGQIKG